MTDNHTTLRMRHAIDSYLEIYNRSSKEEYTDIGELWDIAQTMSNLITRELGNSLKEDPDYEGSELLIDAAFLVFGEDVILSKVDPMTWISDHFVGTYKDLGEWAVEHVCLKASDPTAPYIDWDKYGRDLARKQNLTWVKGGEGIYLFRKRTEKA